MKSNIQLGIRNEELGIKERCALILQVANCKLQVSELRCDYKLIFGDAKLFHPCPLWRIGRGTAQRWWVVPAVVCLLLDRITCAEWSRVFTKLFFTIS